MTNSVCIFHNGNQRIVDIYRRKFSNLDFKGNWACNEFADNSLYEIYYANTSLDVMLDLKKKNVLIVRHISTYNNDIENPIDNRDSSTGWIDNISNFLCFSDKIYSDLTPIENKKTIHALITTGRTASKHYRYYLDTQNISSYEYNKLFDQSLIDSSSATLLWRENSWECATSTYIAIKNNNFIHNHNGKNNGNVSSVGSIDRFWIENDWLNLSQSILNHALLYKFFLKKPINVKTTEEVTSNYITSSKKIKYNKKNLISNYNECKNWYNINIDPILNMLYINTKRLLEENQ